MSPLDYLADRAVWFIPVLLSLTVHEWAHAWAAWRLGDDTAKMMGRLSLNPIDHIDPVGTLLLPLMGVPFGWAKPVPINPTRFRTSISMPMGVLLTAAAGPISNMLIAVVCCLLIAGVTNLAGPQTGMLDRSLYHAIVQLLEFLVTVNILLGLFNLIPIPPLDGSRIVEALVPTRFRPLWTRITTAGPALLILLIAAPFLFGVSLLSGPLEWTHDLLNWITRR